MRAWGCGYIITTSQDIIYCEQLLLQFGVLVSFHLFFFLNILFNKNVLERTGTVSSIFFATLLNK